MRIKRTTLTLVAVSVAAATFMGASNAKPVRADDDSDRRIAIRDDCDPDDPAWNETGGCALKDGDVNFEEFGVELESKLAPTSLIGHQAWRNDPPYLKIEPGQRIKVRNRGGRTHTFTKVADFGGGKIGPPGVGLNKGLETAPECPASTNMLAGTSMTLAPLAPGNHRFQCCIHPWMRAIIKVEAEDNDEEDDE